MSKWVYQLLEKYGFTYVEVSGSNHLRAYHPSTEKFLVCPGSSTGDAKAYENLEAQIRRLLGLSKRGEVAREGIRRKKAVPRQKPKPRPIPPAVLRTLEEIRAERSFNQLNRMMRERP